jgi:glycosyltransferase involved in cell wall biosynthesis
MPLVVLAALAAGTAVVASDLPGTREVLGPLADLCLVPPGDQAVLTDRVRAVLTDDALHADLVARGREIVVRDFSIEACASRCAAVYETVVDGRQPR